MKTKLKVALVGAGGVVIAAVVAALLSRHSSEHPPDVGNGSSGNIIVHKAGGNVTITTAQVAQKHLCGDDDLSLVMERAGDLIPGRHPPPPGHFASGRLYQFTLTNTSDACVVVIKNIELLVRAAIPDNHASMEATTAENDYEVVVAPTDIGNRLPLRPLARAPHPQWSFDFTPKGEPERFKVQVVPSEFGTSYAIQFLVSWYDPSTQMKHTTKSRTFAAFFPSGQAQLFDDSPQVFRKAQIDRWSKSLGEPVFADVE